MRAPCPSNVEIQLELITSNSTAQAPAQAPAGSDQALAQSVPPLTSVNFAIIGSPPSILSLLGVMALVQAECDGKLR